MHRNTHVFPRHAAALLALALVWPRRSRAAPAALVPAVPVGARGGDGGVDSGRHTRTVTARRQASAIYAPAATSAATSMSCMHAVPRRLPAELWRMVGLEYFLLPLT